MRQPEHTAAFTINPSRMEKTRTRLLRRLILALTMLSFSALLTSVAAQVRPPTPPPPTETDPAKPPPRPDLVPLPLTPPVTPCRPQSNSTYLLFRVRNSGNATAPGSRATAVFHMPPGSGTHASIAQVPSLTAGETTNVNTPTPIPSSCFDSVTKTCKFTFYVDSASQVDESNENNNTVSGVCQRAP